MNNVVECSTKFIKRNASTILTFVGGVGVVATTIMAVKATPKALELIEQAEETKGSQLTGIEKFKVAGPVYIPTVLTGAATLACIFGANALNKRQQAALMSAYALIDSSYKEYKNKVLELQGEDVDRSVRTEIAKDRYKTNPVSHESGKVLFYDEFSGRYFEATPETVVKAQYAVNRAIALNGGASINEWFIELDIPPLEYGNGLGWSTGMLMDYQWNKWLEFKHEKVLIDDDLECIIISFSTDPLFDFEYY